MSIENLIYNFGGVGYYEKIEKGEDTYLYEGHHGNYVGDIYYG